MMTTGMKMKNHPKLTTMVESIRIHEIHRLPNVHATKNRPLCLVKNVWGNVRPMRIVRAKRKNAYAMELAECHASNRVGFKVLNFCCWKDLLKWNKNCRSRMSRIGTTIIGASCTVWSSFRWTSNVYMSTWISRRWARYVRILWIVLLRILMAWCISS